MPEYLSVSEDRVLHHLKHGWGSQSSVEEDHGEENEAETVLKENLYAFTQDRLDCGH